VSEACTKFSTSCARRSRQRPRSERRAAADDIRAALDEPDAERSGSLSDQLSQALERFEESHPQLTSIVGRVADALADIGI